MKKGTLQSGENMFVVRVDHFVKLQDFATALAEHFYNKNEEFDKSISKKEAEKILRHRLFFHGLRGEIPEDTFEASFEEGEAFNSVFSDAAKWVKQKYDWLGRSE